MGILEADIQKVYEMHLLKKRGFIPLLVVAIATLLWKIDLFEWVQASVKIPALAPEVADSELWLVVPGSVNDGDTLRVGRDGQEKRIRLRGIDAPESSQPLGDEPRQLLAGGYYAGDWIPKPFPMLTDEERLALLDWHPMFTGRCPSCEMPMRQTN